MIGSDEMNLYVIEERDDDNDRGIILSRNPKVNYYAPCSNPKCNEIGTRSQYGRDDTCTECGSPFDWSREVKWN